MCNKLFFVLAFCLFIFLEACGQNKENKPHLVFVMGDDEYRSEESMPMLASVLQRELGAKISLCYAVDSNGYINPNAKTNIVGLNALESADLMVMFCRFRALPDDQLQYILKYVDSGKPMVGFRTSTHAFQYANDEGKAYLNYEWPKMVFGQQWITHHGHFDDGDHALTSVYLSNNDHIILKGIQPFDAYSWLYHVDGGDWKLYGDSRPIIFGKALRSNHLQELDKFPLDNPVAWTKTHTTSDQKKSRVFFTTLGHPFDFKNENMRRLSIQGILWALGREDLIEKGIDVQPVSPYQPSNSGFGEKHIKGRRP